MPIDAASGRDATTAITPDWSREHKRALQWYPSRSFLAAIRSHQRWSGHNLFHGFMRKIAKWRHRFWSVVTGCDIPLDAKIGGGLLIPHPHGIVIHPNSVVGPNCLIFQQVTLGSNSRGVPVLGAHVDVGAGAKIIGPVTIGNYARIGANAVVVDDVPEGATVVGIPARVVAR
ncbi:serine O-acetyltransferase [Sphingobium subterraneum]|uniref:Serine acetyltransferase n=1 Tax=Sphingobium subterraneum TaxID=627688 RepID=A0A841J2E4_9SPHN|nr:serine O-acetyltransferase [Sphingobium subterraneum]MBB6122491.1 serine O-acetyltransferase [Sphingobium subterraneum]